MYKRLIAGMGCRLTLRGDSDENFSYGAPGKHTPYPHDIIAYQGKHYSVCFIDVTMTFGLLANRVNLGPQAMQTDVENHLNELDETYRNGYRLSEFAKMPGVKFMNRWHRLEEQHPYQLILFKPINCCSDQSWRLLIEKKLLNFNPLTSHSLNDDDDMLNSVAYHAARGARLACAKAVGYVHTSSTNKQYAVTGVELFFEIPQHPQPTIYTYHTVCVQAQYRTTYDVTGVQRVLCDVDFLEQTQSFLSNGWRLVDICVDANALAEVHQCSKKSSVSHPLNICWIFEKEKRLLDNSVPQYEAHVMEYFHEIERFNKEDKSISDWRPLIATMATRGWQITSTVQMPYLVQSTFATFTVKVLLVFQRKIMPAAQNITKFTTQWLTNDCNHVTNHHIG